MGNSSQNIRHHLEILANSKSREILSEIKQETENFHSLIDPEVVPQEEYSSETRFLFTHIKSQIKSAETVASEMETTQSRMASILNKPAVKKMKEMEKQLREETDFRKAGQIKREIAHLKSNYSKENSDLISHQQQLLIKRIRLIHIWKEVLNSEIQILETVKETILKKVYVGALTAEDQFLLETVEKKLAAYHFSPDELQKWKTKAKSLHVANMAVLRETLKENLMHFVKLEKAAKEKKMAFQKLTEIARDMKTDIPEKNIPKDIQSALPNESTQEQESKPSNQPKKQGKHFGMAYQDKKKG